MALIADDSFTLQIMINIATAYATEWLYSFSHSKSAILVIGESSISHCKNHPNRYWSMSGFPLKEVDAAKHLGILLSVNSPHIDRANTLITSFHSCFFGYSTLCARFTIQLYPCY